VNGDHRTTASPTGSIPAARPSRQLGVLAGRERLVALAVELREPLDHDRPRRHVDAEGERLGGEDHLHEAGREARLDRLLERRHHPGVVGGDARLMPASQVRWPSTSRSPRRARGALLADGADAARSSCVGQAEARVQALAHGVVAAPCG
jgi:hypothetical protein